MENFSFLQTIGRIPELRLKYMGSYHSDKVPQLTKFSFAIVNSAPSKDGAEHWIMIARMDENYYFVDSLDRKRTAHSFPTKKYRRMVSRTLLKTDNLCRFYAHYLELLLFEFYLRNLNHNHDVYVLNFISNSM